MSYQTPITESDLHAYLDNELTPSRRQEVEAYMAANPEAASQVAQYRALNDGLTELYGHLPDDDIMDQRPTQPQRGKVWRMAAALVWLGLGSIIGWQAQRIATIPTLQGDTLVSDLSQPAAFAHSVYAVEVRHPVEVTAAEQDHLVAWLSRRMSAHIQAPNLSSQGYALVGGRLLPSTNRMAGQFMYERDDGQRITLYVRRGDWENKHTAFRFTHQDGATLFYWVDGPLGYALVSELDKPQLLPLAHAVYQQLHAGPKVINGS